MRQLNVLKNAGMFDAWKVVVQLCLLADGGVSGDGRTRKRNGAGRPQCNRMEELQLAILDTKHGDLGWKHLKQLGEFRAEFLWERRAFCRTSQGVESGRSCRRLPRTTVRTVFSSLHAATWITRRAGSKADRIILSVSLLCGEDRTEGETMVRLRPRFHQVTNEWVTGMRPVDGPKSPCPLSHG